MMTINSEKDGQTAFLSLYNEYRELYTIHWSL